MDGEHIMNLVFGGIVLLIAGIILWFLFILLPYRLFVDALQVLIGRPFGFGWIPVEAEMQPEETDPTGKHPQPPTGKNEADYKYAIYTVDGTEYKMPYFRKVKEDSLKLYVKKKYPRVIWTQAADNRLTAFVGVVLILGLWVGLALSAVLIARNIMG